MRLKSLMLSVVTLLLAAFAVAQYQYPQGPNTGLQTTPYSNNYFSATFNGSIETSGALRNDNGTSTSYIFQSVNHRVSQAVLVRILDGDIPVDYTSSDFYAHDDRTGGTVINRSQGMWEDHPYTYTCRTFIQDNVEYSRRTRFIIVNSRMAIFITQTSLNSYNDQNEWLDFEYSLRIK